MIKNTRFTRITIGILGPVTLVPILMFFASLFQDGIINAIIVFFISTIGCLLFVGIQSTMYSLIMEFWINRNTNSSIKAILLSAIVGFSFGILFDILLGSEFLAAVGIIVGLIYGFLLRVMYVFENRKDNNSSLYLNINRNKRKIYRCSAILLLYIITYYPIREFHILVHYSSCQEYTNPPPSIINSCHLVKFQRVEVTSINFMLAIPISILGFVLNILYLPLTAAEEMYWTHLEKEKILDQNANKRLW